MELPEVNRNLTTAAALAILVGTSPASGMDVPDGLCDLDAGALGRRVLAVQEALADPTASSAIEAVKALGLDSRHYIMVRGWLSMQLAGDRSIASARGDATPQDIRERIDFLERAIRTIDSGMNYAVCSVVSVPDLSVRDHRDSFRSSVRPTENRSSPELRQ